MDSKRLAGSGTDPGSSGSGELHLLLVTWLVVSLCPELKDPDLDPRFSQLCLKASLASMAFDVGTPSLD